MLVFVYGSLKRGHYNHNYLANDAYVGEDRTKEKYTMLHLGAFPGVDITTSDVQISGEVFNVLDLQKLDLLEGYPNFYDRSTVELESGELAIMYHLNEPKGYSQTTIPSGIWEG